MGKKPLLSEIIKELKIKNKNTANQEDELLKVLKEYEELLALEFPSEPIPSDYPRLLTIDKIRYIMKRLIDLGSPTFNNYLKETLRMLSKKRTEERIKTGRRLNV